MKWDEITFEELYQMPSRNGIYKTHEFHGTGYKIVNMGELFGYDFISNQDMKRLALTSEELDKNSLLDGDLLFGRRSLVEAGAGKCSIVINPVEQLTFESSIIRVRLNKDLVFPKFYYYYFASHQGRGRIKSLVTGTNVKGIRGSELQKLTVEKPPIETQKRIAEILSAYDDLIENNLKRIRLLEESARLLYREWFVRLKFPNHEHTPLIDGLPEVWERKELQDLCKEIRQGISPEQMEAETPYIGLEHIPRRSITLSEWSDASEIQSMKHKFVEGDILFGKIRPYFHKVGVAFIDGVASSDAIVIRPKDENLHGLVLMTVSSDLFVAHATASSYGAKMPRADWKVLQKFIIAVPPESILKEFAGFINPIVKQLKFLVLQNQKLKQARDLLLPRLMSGEVAV